MPKLFTPKTFFRDVPLLLLNKYFSTYNVLTELEYENKKKSKKKLVDAIYDAWLKLHDDLRSKMEYELRQINEMATEGACSAIIDEANWHEENLSQAFSSMESFHERAFWTFLERKQYWEKANIFDRIDSISNRSWKKHNNLPQKPANVSDSAIKNLEEALANYFFSTLGKGKNCEFLLLRRKSIDYFIGYPEDYTQSNWEWQQKTLTNRIHRPAFEIIFAFNEAHGTLEICCKSATDKITKGLQAIFAEVILGVDLVEHENQPKKFMYDLSPLKNRNFQFIFDPIKSGIKAVTVEKLCLAPSDGRKLMLQGNVKENKHDVYDMLEQVGKQLYSPKTNIIQAGIKVEIINLHKLNSTKQVPFNITWPNSCTLEHNETNLPIRQMLIDSGLEPKPIIETEENNANANSVNEEACPT